MQRMRNRTVKKMTGKKTTAKRQPAVKQPAKKKRKFSLMSRLVWKLTGRYAKEMGRVYGDSPAVVENGHKAAYRQAKQDSQFLSFLVEEYGDNLGNL